MSYVDDGNGPADPTPYPMVGESEAFQQFFEDVGGFSAVTLQHIEVPEHVFAFFREEGDSDEDLRDMKACSCYWKVRTDQGLFGVLRVVYPMLDLQETGLVAGDLHTFHGGEEGEESLRTATLTGFDPNDEAFMRRFKDKMAEKKRKE